MSGVVRLLTVREVAERLAVCTATVYALVERGEIHPDDLEAFIARKFR